MKTWREINMVGRPQPATSKTTVCEWLTALVGLIALYVILSVYGCATTRTGISHEDEEYCQNYAVDNAISMGVLNHKEGSYEWTEIMKAAARGGAHCIEIRSKKRN